MTKETKRLLNNKKSQANKSLEALILWSKKSFQQLPWRKQNRLPYKVWVTEIMLQQTTVNTIIKHSQKFLKNFPTLNSLANASQDDVLKAWTGLGYYKRAKNLRETAQTIKNSYSSSFPKEENALKKLAGIGAYTSKAILAIAFNKKVLAVDANIRRVLTRLLDINNYSDKELEEFIKYPLFKQWFQNFSARSINEALMDLGREICQARKALCSQCCLKEICLSKNKNIIIKEQILTQKFNLNLLRIVKKNSKQEILLIKKEKGEWLSDQWELPTYTMSCDKKNFFPYNPITKKILTKKLPMIKSTITQYKIKNFILNNDNWNIYQDFKDKEKIWIKVDSLKKNTQKMAIAHTVKKNPFSYLIIMKKFALFILIFTSFYLLGNNPTIKTKKEEVEKKFSLHGNFYFFLDAIPAQNYAKSQTNFSFFSNWDLEIILSESFFLGIGFLGKQKNRTNSNISFFENHIISSEEFFLIHKKEKFHFYSWEIQYSIYYF